MKLQNLRQRFTLKKQNSTEHHCLCRYSVNSLVLALLQVGGRAPKVDEALINQIKGIKGEYHFETYVSLSCHNCPDVVQALNIMRSTEQSSEKRLKARA